MSSARKPIENVWPMLSVHLCTRTTYRYETFYVSLVSLNIFNVSAHIPSVVHHFPADMSLEPFSHMGDVRFPAHT